MYSQDKGLLPILGIPEVSLQFKICSIIIIIAQYYYETPANFVHHFRNVYRLFNQYGPVQCAES